MATPETPRTEKGRDIKKPEMDPRKETPDKKDVDPNWGIPESNNIETEDQPSPQMGKAQNEFMKPERADLDSNIQSGAV